MMKASRSEFITVRGLRMHVRHWGRETAPKIVMVHGWMDVSASFQFVVNALVGEFHVIAPDWRGFGLSDNSSSDSYWFPDYLGDLDAILQWYSPEAPVNLVGHSMGGNVAMLYAGVRPARIRKLINLEGFGMAATRPEQAPARFAKWLSELQVAPVMQTYATKRDVAARLQKTNPRLSDERAEFLAAHWARESEPGVWRILADPAHKLSNPILYRVEEVLACWKEITAPVLWVEAEDCTVWSFIGGREQLRAEIDRRIACVHDLQRLTVMNAGHMLHHDQPEQLAQAIESFIA